MKSYNSAKALLGFSLCLILVLVHAERTLFCERIEKVHWPYFHHRHLTCIVNETSVIESDDYRISSDVNATGVYFNDNPRIFYLPQQLSKVFPRLMVIDVTYCSIKKVSLDNFEGLVNLRRLWLRDNLIEEIPADTFRDLISLIDIDLRYNLIKFIHHEVFLGLPLLEEINLAGNVCLFRDFNSTEEASAAIAKECQTKPDIETEASDTPSAVTVLDESVFDVTTTEKAPEDSESKSDANSI